MISSEPINFDVATLLLAIQRPSNHNNWLRISLYMQLYYSQLPHGHVCKLHNICMYIMYLSLVTTIL